MYDFVKSVGAFPFTIEIWLPVAYIATMIEHISYVSTRGVEGAGVSYTDALLAGLAPDKGLYIPKTIPQLSEADLQQLVDVPYTEVFTTINRLFTSDSIPDEVHKQLTVNAFTPDKFPNAVNGNITPVHEIADGIFIQELSLGPTAAFKDMALQPLGQQMDFVLGRRGDTLRMLGATSGDTGSSAEAAIKGLGSMSLTMLSPSTGMSSFQKAQMMELSGGNIQNVSVDGRFDDCQDMVKALKMQPEFADLGAVNSINWGRVAAQVPYYVHGYLQAVGGDVGKPVDFVVPSGNFGNVLAGHIARKMGVPIRQLIVATNENSVIDTLVKTGVYKRPPAAHVTSSPSMDITVASNYERLLADIFPDDPEHIRAYMKTFEQRGEVDFAQFGVSNDVMHKLGFSSGQSTHADRLDAIRWAYQNGRYIDPHTADAVTVARRIRMERHDTTVPLVCMSTALPVKFENTMLEALGHIPPRPERYIGLEERTRTLGNFATIRSGDITTLASLVRAHGA